MSVCGGGVYCVLDEEREGYSSKVRWKKYSGIRGDRIGRTCQRASRLRNKVVLESGSCMFGKLER
jgi:hypothetical protein